MSYNIKARTIDLLVAMSVVDNASKKLQLLRYSDAQDMIGKAEKLATEFEFKRVRRKKRQTLDEGVDERSSSANDNWKIEVFYAAIDSAINVLEEKFHAESQRMFWHKYRCFSLRDSMN